MYLKHFFREINFRESTSNTQLFNKKMVLFENRIMYVMLKLPLNNAEMEELIVKSMDYMWLDVKDVKKMNLLPQVHTYVFTFSSAVLFIFFGALKIVI